MQVSVIIRIHYMTNVIKLIAFMLGGINIRFRVYAG